MSVQPQLKIDIRRLPVLAKQQIDKAELPTLYKAAVLALRECDRVDELKDVKDKHSAIAIYAKQAKDKTLQYYAERIRLRAVERIGELLSEIPGHNKQKEAIKASGLDHNTGRRAIDMSYIPRKVRDKLIDQEPPPKLTELANHGSGYNTAASYHRSAGFDRYLEKENEVRPSPRAAVVMLRDDLRSIFNNFCRSYLDNGVGGIFKISELGRAIDPEDADDFRKELLSIIEILDELESALPKKLL